MSEALERVIAEQQREIDRQKVTIEYGYKTLNQNYGDYIALKDAAFSLMDSPGQPMYREAMRDLLRKQNWCLECRECPCECDYD